MWYFMQFYVIRILGAGSCQVLEAVTPQSTISKVLDPTAYRTVTPQAQGYHS
jgi:hypothetical protein